MDVPPPTAAEFDDAEMPLAKDGPVLLIAGCYVFMLGCVAVALFNLMHPSSTPLSGLIASIIWLFLVCAAVGGSCFYEGPKHVLIVGLGNLAARQFVQIQRKSGEATLVCFGYRLCGMCLYYLKLRVDEIASVEWDSGQATAMAGHDMNDWRVFLRYDASRLASRATPDNHRPSQEIHCVGRSGPKSSIAEFGRTFVEFLRRAGADLAPTENGRGFARLS